jgi:hypothetical protein
MDVRIVKLITGEELLSQYEENADQVVLTKPMMLIMQSNGLQMVPWLVLMFCSGNVDKVTLKPSQVLFSYEPKLELANGYRQQVGSIVTAPAGVLDKKGKLQI